MPEAIEFQLYNKLNTTLVAALPGARARRWLDPENDAGSGEMELHADDPVATGTLTDAGGDAVYGNVVRCNLNGTTRFAWIIEENTKGTAKAGEEVEKVLRLAGKGLLGYFQRAVLYPERGIGHISPDARLFNWTSRDFNDASWTAATQVKRQDAIVTLNSWNGLPKDWPDPTAYWIWGAAGLAAADVPAGDAYFRKSFTMAANAPCVITFTADDGVELYLDNTRIASKSTEKGHSWPQAARTDVLLDAGAHLLAAKATNVLKTSLDVSTVINIAGLIVAVHKNSFGQTLPGNTDYGALVTHTDNTWKVLQYPPGGPPGMTPGEVMRIMFTEAQTRGAIPGVTWSFTDANDSNGNPWATVPDLGFEVGVTYYAALRQIAEVACDLHMDPTSLRLDAYNQRGSASSAVLSIASNITDLEHQGTGDVTNSILLRFADGWREVLSAASIATGGRQESHLSVGTAPSLEQATLASQAVFAEQANPRDAIVVTHEGRPGSGTEPYASYNVGDTISVPDRAGVASLEIVKAITVGEDDEGNPIFTPEVRSLSSEIVERIQRWIKRMSQGSVAGTSENASPYPKGAGDGLAKITPNATPSGLRYATVVVAASNSLHPQDADFVCSGVNDHTTIVAAFASLPVSGGGGRVLLMEGTYNIAARVTPNLAADTRSLTLEGQGAGTVLNLTATTANSLIFLGASAAALTSPSVKNLRIQGNGFSCSRAVAIRGQRPHVENVWVNNLTVTDNVFSSSFDGLTTFINCQAKTITGGVGNFGVWSLNYHFLLQGCACSGLTNLYSVYVSPVEDFGPYEGFMASCFFDGQGAGSGLGGITGFPRGCMVGCCVISQGPALETEGNTIGAVITSNDFYSTGGHTVQLDGDSGLLVGNRISGRAGASFDYVRVASGAEDCAVLSNYLFSDDGTNPRTAIRVEAGALRTVVLANVVNSTSGITTAFTDLGTGTVVDYAGGSFGDNATI